MAISDNLRYFSERPNGFKFWDRVYEINLALSIIIKRNHKQAVEEIQKLQNEIIEQLKGQNIVYKPYTKEDGLYKYPGEDLHFTLINFIKYKKTEKVELEKVKLKNDSDYKKIRNIIKRIIKKNERYIIKGAKMDLRWVYSGADKKELDDSVTLQAIPNIEFRNKLIKLDKEIEGKTKKLDEKLNKKFKSCRVGIKAYPKEAKRAFAVNILRFVRGVGNTSKLKGDNKLRMVNIVEKINRDHNKKPLVVPQIKINKLNLVESDPFLYNHTDIKTFCLNGTDEKC